MRIMFLLALTTITACGPKQPVEVLATAEPVVEEPQELDAETHCATADSYTDLVAMSQLQFTVSKGLLEEVIKGRAKLNQGVNDLYLGRIVMYEPSLPDDADDQVNEALSKYWALTDTYMDQIRADVDLQLARALEWKESTAESDVAMIRSQCRMVEREIDVMVDEFAAGFAAMLEPVVTMIATLNLKGEGLERSTWLLPGPSFDPGPLPPFLGRGGQEEYDRILREMRTEEEEPLDALDKYLKAEDRRY